MNIKLLPSPIDMRNFIEAKGYEVITYKQYNYFMAMVLKNGKSLGRGKIKHKTEWNARHVTERNIYVKIC